MGVKNRIIIESLKFDKGREKTKILARWYLFLKIRKKVSRQGLVRIFVCSVSM
jgi:hypothetical protein